MICVSGRLVRLRNNGEAVHIQLVFSGLTLSWNKGDPNRPKISRGVMGYAGAVNRVQYFLSNS